MYSACCVQCKTLFDIDASEEELEGGLIECPNCKIVHVMARGILYKSKLKIPANFLDKSRISWYNVLKSKPKGVKQCR